MVKKCAICGNKIGFLDQDLSFKDGKICGKEIIKYKFSKKPGSDVASMKAINWADNHTIEDLKNHIAKGENFLDILNNRPEKICFNCRKKATFLNPLNELKDGYLCSNCFENYGFSQHANSQKMTSYLTTITVKECQELIENPEKLRQVKIKNAYVKHFYEDDATAQEKQKQKLEKYKEHDNKVAKVAAKQQENEEKYEKMFPIFQKEATAKFGPYIFNDNKQQILRKKSFLSDPQFINYSDIISYRINQQGHNETKKHGITRAIVGGAIAGGVGAIVGATTGGKQTDYIDHLGIIVNLKDGNNFEIVFIRKIEEIKSNTLSARDATSRANNLISILDAIIAHNQLSPSQPADTWDKKAEQLKKYKQLLDDNDILQKEYDDIKAKILNEK
ncbi:hypothetical protein [Lactobacillus helveticus]|uniref:hypothetical protein n=1 Tax=Lactobacillus helveticus TaxID=1587 RepID=UPI0015620CC0|nr:hypothetical protein [Lactobacillus helveticus]NRO05395.1 hypothetical protein [Lactobacillus helveticus]